MSSSSLRTSFTFGMLFCVAAGAAGAQERSGSAPLSPAAQPGVGVEAPAYLKDELLVVWRPGTTEAEKELVRRRIDAALIEDITTMPMRETGYGELELARLPAGTSVFAAIDALRGVPSVRFSEPNWILMHGVVSNDTYYTNGSLWGMYGDATSPANQYGCQAGEAWAAGHTGSSTVYVGVIDEGVMHAHQDLTANIWINPFDPVNGVDDDSNGYVDDLRGWDFAGNNNTTYDNTQDDHGTHVSGTIGAVGGNGVGVAGVNWSVKIITCKFLSGAGGTIANAIRAVDYLTDLKNRHGMNIVASNNSYSGGGFSQAMFDAIGRANTANILFCAAAGNDNGRNIDSSPVYPASYTNPNVISVASITSTGARSSFSNVGPNSVDLGAPGSTIYSTLPSNNGRKYGAYSGTSMATPHVTGACALYASTHAGASAAAIKSAILGSTVPTASLAGLCVTGGRLNVSGF